MLASDASAVIERTRRATSNGAETGGSRRSDGRAPNRRVTYLNDGEMVVVARTPSGACTQRDQGARPRIFPTLARARTLGACTYEIKTLENIKLCREVEELQLKLEDNEVVN